MVIPHVLHTRPAAPPPTLLAALRDLGSATTYEAAGRQGAMVAAIKPIDPGMRLCGPALTVGLPAGDNLIIHRAVALVRPGDVIVCDIDGWEGGPWGELLTEQARAQGAAGLVIDGFVRDSAAIAEMGFPVFARGLSVRGTDKDQLGLVNHPIICGGTIVRPGDIVVGDADGVVVVRGERRAEVLDAAMRREREEAEWRQRFRAGETSWSSSGFQQRADQLGLCEEVAK
jgi:4-hydroxy-4-methyl-2-oxoglutarate aldolase